MLVIGHHFDHIVGTQIVQRNFVTDGPGNLLSLSTADPTSHITSQLIQDTLEHYLGNISQVPPIFSALKRQGKPLYKYAREGQQIAIEPREVIIHNIDLLAVTNPYIDLRVECGAGTYIRSLAHDLGNSLGGGGHLSALIREDSSGFNIAV